MPKPDIELFSAQPKPPVTVYKKEPPAPANKKTVVDMRALASSVDYNRFKSSDEVVTLAKALSRYILNENSYSLKNHGNLLQKFKYNIAFSGNKINEQETFNTLSKVKLAIAYEALADLIENRASIETIKKTIASQCATAITDNWSRDTICDFPIHKQAGKLEKALGISEEVNEAVKKTFEPATKITMTP